MNRYQKIFPHLTLFSDLNWEEVTQEYESEYIDVTFPDYLQKKFLDGDCPSYLFEVAYFELALHDVQHSTRLFPFKAGIYLNPTALFLSLEFDVRKTIEQATQGHVEIIERSHVLCIFKNKEDKICINELSKKELVLLTELEHGAKESMDFIDQEQKKLFDKLVKDCLILDLTLV